LPPGLGITNFPQTKIGKKPEKPRKKPEKFLIHIHVLCNLSAEKNLHI
jgi:hypothetical protein